MLILSGLMGIFTKCKKEHIQVKTIKSETVRIDQSIDPDSLVMEFISPYQEKLTKEVNEIIGYNAQTLTNEITNLQSSLGNTYADICLEYAQAKYEKETGKKSILPCLITVD